MQEMIIVKNFKIFFLHLIFDRCYLLNRVYIYIYNIYTDEECQNLCYISVNCRP